MAQQSMQSCEQPALKLWKQHGPFQLHIKLTGPALSIMQHFPFDSEDFTWKWALCQLECLRMPTRICSDSPVEDDTINIANCWQPFTSYNWIFTIHQKIDFPDGTLDSGELSGIGEFSFLPISQL
ncbi:hypothetical protein TWF970_010785 [Orbilia oligospora]|uniref:Uncharacterized protein n=1 Tax=Orbilia oligospora TaxID=2813651 RepID=A0A7C8V7G8_ORBOL|nr:hypothetical protein TWF970_010785 [Orbilia oligospora]